MKRIAVTLIVVALSAAIFYGVLSHVMFDAGDGTANQPLGAPVFALGGLLSPADISGGAAALQRLSAAHCAGGAFSLTPARPEELGGTVPWERGDAAYVLCPGASVFRRESVSGYLVGCEGKTASLYVRLGRSGPEDLAGCLVVLGGGEPVIVERTATDVGEGRGLKAAFMTGSRTYAWTSPSEEVVPLAAR